GEVGLNPILPSAVAQGKAAGASMAGRPEAYERWIPMNVFNFFGCTGFSVGTPMPVGAEFEAIASSDAKNKSYRKLVLKGGRLVGAMFVNVAADPGIFGYLMRRKLDIGAFRQALLEKPREVSRHLMIAAEKKDAAVVE
ncbi:MAG: hypothetical protein Q7R39_14990, partial [Dehalococcoidia bacterium]|nr:hypothetical protein [Dehalococcoidia bacterium]